VGRTRNLLNLYDQTFSSNNCYIELCIELHSMAIIWIWIDMSEGVFNRKEAAETHPSPSLPPSASPLPGGISGGGGVGGVVVMVARRPAGMQCYHRWASIGVINPAKLPTKAWEAVVQSWERRGSAVVSLSLLLSFSLLSPLLLSLSLSLTGEECTNAAVAQEVRAVVWQQEGCWFDPRAPPSQVSRCP